MFAEPPKSFPVAHGSAESRTAPYLRAMSSADLRLVPSASTNVVGRVMNWSVSFEAIQMKRGESSVVCGIFPALAKCQRRTESAVAQPTHEPVDFWSLIFHQSARRSLVEGMRGAVAIMSASCAVRNVQSSSVSGDGTTFRIRFGWRFLDARLRGLGFGFGACLRPAMGYLLRACWD